MIVSDVPGTTRDTIDTVLTRGETTFVLVDTAGLRRKRRQRQGIEYYSELRALDAAGRADVALVLVDASEGVVEQDLAVADVARKAGCSTLVVLSKWDVTTLDLQETRGMLNRRLRQRPPAVAVSALTGRGLRRLLDHVEALFAKHTTRIPTPALNKALGGAKEARPGPAGERGRRLKLLYVDPDGDAPAAAARLRQRPTAPDPRLRLLGRERAAGALRAPGRPGVHRLPALRVNVVVLGGGSWGTAFARLLADRGHTVTLACRDAEQAAAIRETGRNPRYLSGVDLTGVDAAAIADAPVADANLVVVAVPSASFGEVVAAIPGSAPILSLTKGLDPATGDRLSTLVAGRPVAVLSGPNIADEVARGLPAAAVIACESMPLAVQLQLAITSTAFRVYVNDDLVGVELCAAAKNVIALAAGGADGLGLGDNAKAALVTRGLVEMGRLAEVAGARPETFAGLAGMGDLIVTCWSKSGRNRRCGELVAQGATPAEAARDDRHGGRGPDDRARAPRPRPQARRRDADHRGRLRGARRHPADGAPRAPDGARPDGGVIVSGGCADPG